MRHLSPGVKRVLSNTVVATAAIGASLGMILLMMPELRDPLGVPKPHPEPTYEQKLILFDACIVFYAVFYSTARAMYRAFGLQKDLEEAKSLSAQHMPLLHMTGSFLWTGLSVSAIFFDGRQGWVEWIALAGGLVWSARAIRDVIRSIRLARTAARHRNSPGNISWTP
jgi:hypothetical protein